MSRSEKIVDLEVHRLHSTDKAVLITTDLPEWLAIDKGLI